MAKSSFKWFAYWAIVFCLLIALMYPFLFVKKIMYSTSSTFSSNILCTNKTCIHGACIDNTTCQCNEGWSGSLCDICEQNCSEHGHCDPKNGTCICNNHWLGQICDVCDQNCSGHGHCDPKNGTCICNNHWLGSICDVCDQNCSDHGHCDPKNGTCICNNSWTGASCDKCTTHCINGHCQDNGMCQCNEGWHGSLCDICKQNCSSHGHCDPKNGTCICNNHWTGKLCGTCTKKCLNGHCHANGTCQCNDGWYGTLCDTCKHSCAGHGHCDPKNGTCICNNHWLRPQCEVCDQNCSGHGHCDPKNGSCICTDAGYDGKICDHCKCEPNGYCLPKNETSKNKTCRCNDTYWGDFCQKRHCNGSCNHGHCLDTGICSCIKEYHGPHCDICKFHCQHGKCRPDGKKCNCNKNWGGLHCETCLAKCIHGHCRNNGSCKCDINFKGPNCDICLRDCNHGKCNSNGTACNCKRGWTGTFCKKCDNGYGCINGDCHNGTCICYKGYEGEDCNEVTITEVKSLSYLLIFSSLISVIACLFVLLKKNRNVSPVFFWKCVSDLGFCLQMIALQVIILVAADETGSFKNESYQPPGCQISAFFTQFFIFASLSWYVLLSFDYYKSVSNPFQRLNTRMKTYHLFVWPSSLLTGSILSLYAGYRPGLHICWARASSHKNYVLLFVFELWLLLSLTSSVIILFLCWLKQLDGQFKRTLSIRKKILTSQQHGVILFTIFWVCITMMWIYFERQSIAGEDGRPVVVKDIMVRYIFSFILPLFGCLHILLWWMQEREGNLNCCVRSNKISQFRERINSVDKMFTLIDKNNNPDQDAYISKMLRSDFIARTTQGIKMLTKKTCCLESMGKKSYLSGTIKQTQSNLPWFFKYFGLGIAQTISMREYGAIEFRKLRRICYRMNDRQYLYSLAGRTDHSTKQMTKGFKEASSRGSFYYYSADNQFIIKTIKHYEKDNLMKLLQDYANYMHDIGHDHHEIKTNGCQDFSIIARLYGLYSIKMYGIVKYFVVMENVLSTNLQIHERYDLNGSWINRHGQKHGVLRDNDLKRNLEIDEEQAKHIFASAWRDVAFLSECTIMGYSLLLGIHFCSEVRPEEGHCSAIQDSGNVMEKKETPRNSINDVAFRQIPSVECLNLQNSGSENKEAIGLRRRKMKKMKTTSSFYGGCTSMMITGPGIYYMGIIDIMQFWDWPLSAKSVLQGLIYGRAQTAINPIEYAQRFLLMLRKRFNIPLCAFRHFKGMEVTLDGCKAKNPLEQNDPSSLPPSQRLYLIQVSYKKIQLQNWETWETLQAYDCTLLWQMKLEETDWGTNSIRSIDGILRAPFIDRDRAHTL